MARGFTFRFSSEGYDEIRRQLEALGPLGKTALDQINQGSPVLRNNMRAAAQAMDEVRDKLEAVQTSAVKARAEMSQTAWNNSFGMGSTSGQRGPDYAGFWAKAAVEQDRAITTAAGKSQNLVNALLGVKDFVPLAAEVKRDYADFWSGVLSQQDRTATTAAGKSQSLVNALLGVKDFAPLAAEVRGDYADLWQNLLAQQDAGIAKETAHWQDRSRGLKDAIDPAAAAQRRYAQQIADADALLAKGAITYPERQRAVRQYGQELTAATRAISANGAALAEHGRAANMAAMGLTTVNANLFNTAQVLVATKGDLISAIGPLGDVAQGFAMMGGSAATTAAIVAGVVAPVIAVTAAQQSYLAGARAVANANQVMGGAVGRTGDQFEAMAGAAADAAKISVRAAQDQQAAYLRTGTIGAESMGKLIAQSRDYAVATGQDMDAAVKDLADTFIDPAKGAEKLAGSLNLLSGQQLAYIRSLQASGQGEQARLALSDALNSRIKGMGDNVSVLARAWESVSTAVSNALSSVGKATLPETNDAAIQRLEGKRQQLLVARGLNDQRVAYETGGLAGAESVPIDERYTPRGMVTATGELADVDRELEHRRMNADELRRGALRQADDAARRRASVEGDTVARTVRPIAADIETLTANIDKLEKGIGSGFSGAGAQGQQALSALKNQLTDYRTVAASGLDLQTYKQAELAKVEKQYAGMVGPQRDILLAKERERINLIGTATTADERRSAVVAASAQVIAGQTQAVAQQNVQLSAQAQGALVVGAAWMQGGVAAARADAMRQASIDALTMAIDPAIRAQQLLAEQAAKTVESGGQQAYQFGLQADAAMRVAEASVQGAEAQHAAEVQEKVRNATIAESTALQYAQGETADALRKVIDAKTAAIIKEDAAQRKAAAGAILQQQRDQLELGRAELSLMGASAVERARTIALLQAEQQIRKEKIDTLSHEAEGIRDNAVALADQQLAIKRSQDAYRELENFGEKAFGSLLDKMVQTGKQTLSWADALKAVKGELQTLIIKMAAINPLKNALIGTNLPTLTDLTQSVGMGQAAPAVANQAGGGGLGSAGNILSLGSKLMPSSWTSGLTSSLDTWAYNTLGIGSMATTTSSMMTTAGGGLAAELGVMPVAGGVSNAAAAGSTAATAGSLTGGLSTYFGPAGAGALGGIAGGMIGTATNSKAVGAVSGAALGAGAAGLASLMGLSALGGPVGLAVAAVVGAIMGGIGTQKATVGPNAQGFVDPKNGHFAATKATQDNGGDVGPVQDVIDKMATAYNLLIDNYGLKINTDGGIGFWSGAEKVNGQGAHTVEDLVKSLTAKLSGDGLVGRALKTDAVKNLSDPQEIAAYLSIAKGIEDGATALKDYDKSLSGVAKSAREAAGAQYDALYAQKAKAADMGMGEEYLAVLKGNFEAMLDGIVNPVEFTQFETAAATATGKLQAMADASANLGLGLGDAVAAAERALKGHLLTLAYDEIDRAIHSIDGRSYIDSLHDVQSAYDVNVRQLTALGGDTARAMDLASAQIKQAFEGLNSTQAADAASVLTGALGDLAKGLAATRAEAVRSTALADYQAQLMAAQGRDYVTTIQSLVAGQDAIQSGLDAAGVGDAATKAAELTAALIKQAINGLDAGALADIANTMTGVAGDAAADRIKSMLFGMDAGQLYDMSIKLTGTLGDLAGAMWKTAVAAGESAKMQEQASEARAANDNLLARALTLQGRDYRGTLATIDARAAQELASAAPGTDTAMLLATQSVERYQAGLTALEGMIQEQIDARAAEIQAIQDTVSQYDSLVTSLRQTRDDFKTNRDLSPLDHAGRMAEAQRQASDLYAKALGGDTAAAQQFATAASVALEATKDYYASTSDYTAYFSNIDDMLSSLTDRYGAADEPARQQATLAQSSLDVSRQQLADIRAQRAAIERVPASIDALAALAQSQLGYLASAMDTLTQVTAGKTTSADKYGAALALASQGGMGLAQSLGIEPEKVSAFGVKLGGNDAQAAAWLAIARQAGYEGQGGDGRITNYLATVSNDVASRALKLGNYVNSNPSGNALGLLGDMALAKAYGYTAPFTVDGWAAYQEAAGIGDQVGALMRLINVRGFADGTDSAPPGMAWVGEQGPELVRFAGGEQVYPHHLSMKMVGARGERNDETAALLRQVVVELRNVVRVAAAGGDGTVAALGSVDARLASIERQARLDGAA